jgi:hypothetical protein
MHLILKTFADNQEGSLASCASLQPTLEFLERLEYYREKAVAVSYELGVHVTLTFDDTHIEVYQYEPDGAGWDEGAMGSGWCLVPTSPFDVETEPLDLAYCYIAVSPKGVMWEFAVQQKYSGEEYTAYLRTDEWETIRQALLAATTEKG